MRPFPDHRRHFCVMDFGSSMSGAALRQGDGDRPPVAPLRRRGPALVVVLAASVLLGLTGSCSPSTSSAEQSAQTSETAATEAIAPSSDAPTAAATPPPPTAEELLSAATTQANQARSLADSAQSRDDWALVASFWEGAIALLEEIPEDAPEHATAQQNQATYRESLATAQQAASTPVDTTPRLTTPQPAAAESTATAETPATTAATASGATSAAPDPTTAPAPTTEQASGSAEVALATHLTQSGARMYAAYWCSYCERQQQLFGEAAVQQLEIIECDPRGDNPQVDRCRAANISGFPTWEIDGQQYPGLQSLDRLADLSGYDGPRNFSN